MRKPILIIPALAAALAVPAMPATAMETQTKQELTAIGTLAVATAAAGPIGFVAGAIGASWLALQVEQADQYTVAAADLADTRERLLATQTELETLNGSLLAAQEEQSRFAKMALDQLQLEMLFKTGDASLTDTGRKRLELLASFLRKNPDLIINIEGFADPRGDANANLALSQARAAQVADALAQVGIPRARMRVVAHGEAKSRASEGDIDAYAMERLVRIELNRQGTNRQVADVTLRGQR